MKAKALSLSALAQFFFSIFYLVLAQRTSPFQKHNRFHAKQKLNGRPGKQEKQPSNGRKRENDKGLMVGYPLTPHPGENVTLFLAENAFLFLFYGCNEQGKRRRGILPRSLDIKAVSPTFWLPPRKEVK